MSRSCQASFARRPVRLGRARVAIPGSCGELIQGWVGGGPLLVSCPIDRYAVATVEVTPDGIIRSPADRPKSRRATEVALAAFGRPGLGARLTIASSLPVAKGFGSSTADVGATLYATARALGREPDPIEVARLAAGIEPTDSTILPGLAAFDHRHARTVEPLGPAPPLHLAVLDLGGTVDTLAFHATDRLKSVAGSAEEFGAVYDLLRAGLRVGRADWIGRAATRSAELHQAILPKPDLPALIALTVEAGGLGVVIAHSGTIVGLLTDRGVSFATCLARRARESLQRPLPVQIARVIGGGPRGR